jgi:hypothetical protein
MRAALGHAYVRVQVPTGLDADGSLRFASRELATVLAAGRGLHERVREALDTHVSEKVFPSKVVTLASLDERDWGRLSNVAQALPRFFEAPKVWTAAALTLGVAEGVQQGTFGYAAVANASEDGALSVARPSDVRLSEPLSPDAVALDGDAVVMRVALAERLQRPDFPPAPEPWPPDPIGPDPVRPPRPDHRSALTGVGLEITATEDDIFVLNRALSKLREIVGDGQLRIALQVQATAGNAVELDRVRVQNAVLEPLEEDPDVSIRVEWVEG